MTYLVVIVSGYEPSAGPDIGLLLQHQLAVLRLALQAKCKSFFNILAKMASGAASADGCSWTACGSWAPDTAEAPLIKAQNVHA